MHKEKYEYIYLNFYGFTTHTHIYIYPTSRLHQEATQSQFLNGVYWAKLSVFLLLGRLQYET